LFKTKVVQKQNLFGTNFLRKICLEQKLFKTNLLIIKVVYSKSRLGQEFSEQKSSGANVFAPLEAE
jgi:hypothetical protein